jgi:hypothetical protein
LVHGRGIGAETGTGLTSVLPLPQGRNEATLNTISVTERAANIIQAGGFFQLALNPGYSFANIRTTLNPSGNIIVETGNPNLTAEFIGFNSDNTIAYFRTGGNTSIRGNAVSINISGLRVARNSDASYGYLNNNVATLTSSSIGPNDTFSFRNLAGTMVTEGMSGVATGVSNATTDVTSFAGHAIAYRLLPTNTAHRWNPLQAGVATPAPILNHPSGRANITTHAVEIIEVSPNSIWWDRDLRFSLVDNEGNALSGAKIAEVRVLDTLNLQNFETSTPTRFFENDHVRDFPQARFTRTFVEFRDLRKTNNDVIAGMQLQFVINTAANFHDEVFVRVSGTGIPEGTSFAPPVANHHSAQSQRIGGFERPINIIAETTDVTIGYQTFRTADIQINEQIVERIRHNASLDILIQEFASAGAPLFGQSIIVFNPIQASDVIRANTNSTLNWDRVTMQGNMISLAISRPSTNEDYLGRIRVENVAVRINRDVPF